MNEFLAFISNGTVESFENDFKEKFCYLLKIVYYSFALFFVIALVHGLYLYFGSGEGTEIISRANNALDRELLIPMLIAAIVSPLLLAFSVTLCLTSFNQSKISICVSIFLSSTIIYATHYLKIIDLGSNHYLLITILALSLVGVFYLIFSNLFDSKTITRIESHWNKRLMLISYLCIGLVVLINLLVFRRIGFINIVSVAITSAILILLLIYIRRLLGFYWSISLHYLLLPPAILTITYLIVNN